jgi:hypothetical protein
MGWSSTSSSLPLHEAQRRPGVSHNAHQRGQRTFGKGFMQHMPCTTHATTAAPCALTSRLLRGPWAAAAGAGARADTPLRTTPGRAAAAAAVTRRTVWWPAAAVITAWRDQTTGGCVLCVSVLAHWPRSPVLKDRAHTVVRLGASRSRWCAARKGVCSGKATGNNVSPLLSASVRGRGAASVLLLASVMSHTATDLNADSRRLR